MEIENEFRDLWHAQRVHAYMYISMQLSLIASKERQMIILAILLSSLLISCKL